MQQSKLITKSYKKLTRFSILSIFGMDNLTVLPYLLTTAHNSTLACFQAENIQKRHNGIWQLDGISAKIRQKSTFTPILMP